MTPLNGGRIQHQPALHGRRLMLPSLALCAYLCACQQQAEVPQAQTSADAPTSAFLDAFRADRFAEAAAIAADKAAGGDPAWLAWQACALQAQGAHREAVDAFVRAACRSHGGHTSRERLHREVMALARAPLPMLATETAARFEQTYPNSQLLSQQQPAVERCRDLLARGMDQGQLNWLYRTALDDRDAGLHGLALARLDEHQALAVRVLQSPPDPDVDLLRGALALHLGDAARALTSLERVPLSYQDWESGLLRIQALQQHNQWTQARELIDHVRTQCNRDTVLLRLEGLATDMTTDMTAE